MERIQGRRLASKSTVFIVLVLVALVMLYPFYFMLSASLRSFQQYETQHGFSLASWRILFHTLPVFHQLLNSTVVTVGSVLLILLVSTMGGYAFAKLKFRGRGAIFLLIVASMMIPMESVIIPEYTNLARLGMINHVYAVIFVYAALGGPFSTYLMTTYFRGIPHELLEAAVIDGFSYPKMFTRIMLPLAWPAMATVGVLQFIQVWDDLLVALLFLQEPTTRTITVGLATLQASRISNIPVLMAGSIISAVPAIIVYLIFQRYLITGLTMGVQK